MYVCGASIQSRAPRNFIKKSYSSVIMKRDTRRRMSPSEHTANSTTFVRQSTSSSGKHTSQTSAASVSDSSFGSTWAHGRVTQGSTQALAPFTANIFAVSANMAGKEVSLFDQEISKDEGIRNSAQNETFSPFFDHVDEVPEELSVLVIALQECSHSRGTANKFGKFFDRYETKACYACGTINFECHLYIVSNKRLSISFETVNKSGSRRCFGQAKTCVIATISTSAAHGASVPMFRVAAAHLPFNSKTPNDNTERKAMLEHIQDRLNVGPPLATLLLGDLNFRINSQNNDYDAETTLRNVFINGPIRQFVPRQPTCKLHVGLMSDDKYKKQEAVYTDNRIPSICDRAVGITPLQSNTNIFTREKVRILWALGHFLKSDHLPVAFDKLTISRQTSTNGASTDNSSSPVDAPSRTHNGQRIRKRMSTEVRMSTRR